MRFLIVNDDGIQSEGIEKLAEMAVQMGETWVVAPDHQCSGMSQKITLNDNVRVTRWNFPVKGVYRAYACTGTPADCTDIAVKFLMKEAPDYVFSGINKGLNAGYDVAYSGTDGAAMEALLCGIPAIAFSHNNTDDFEVTNHYLREITEKILEKTPYRDRIWNVNIPECTLAKCKGIEWNTRLADAGFYEPAYQLLRAEYPSTEQEEYLLKEAGTRTNPEKFAPGTDLHAIMNGYISVGTVAWHGTQRTEDN